MGNYQNYLDGVHALFSGPNARFRNSNELAQYVELNPAQVMKYSRPEHTKNLEKICSFLDKVGAQIVFQGQELNGFILIPRVEAVAGCGESYVVDDNVGSLYAFRENFFRQLSVNPKNMKLMFVSGDSMQPTIKDGDIILFDENDRDVREGYIYVLNYDGALMVKRLQRISNGWNICSENPSYPPVSVQGQELDKLTVFGRVRWFGRVV